MASVSARHITRSPSTPTTDASLDAALVDLVRAASAGSGPAGGTPNPRTPPSGHGASPAATLKKIEAQILSLLAAGSNPDSRDDRGRPVLVCALDGSLASPELIRLLLTAGATPDLPTINYSTPVSPATGTGSGAPRRGEGGSMVPGTTALHYAAQRGYQVCVGLLLTAGADVNVQDARGNTPLFLAAKAGHSPTVRMLLLHGADVTRVNLTNQTPLHAATLNPNNMEVVRILLDAEVSLTSLDSSRQTALLYAARDHRLELVETILQHASCDSEPTTDWLNSTSKRTNKTALHHSVDGAHISGVRLLIERGAELNLKDLDWRSPFFLALRGGECGDEVVLGRDVSQAADERRDTIAYMLMDAGCDVVGTDRTFMTTLHAAAWRGLNDIVLRILQTTMIAADIKGGQSGLTPLMMAAEAGHADVVGSLLLWGANPDSVDKYRATALVYVIMSVVGGAGCKGEKGLNASILSGGESVIVKLLLRFNCDPNISCNIYQWVKANRPNLNLNIDCERLYCPLEITLLAGRPDLFLLLIKAGCDVTNIDLEDMLGYCSDKTNSDDVMTARNNELNNNNGLDNIGPDESVRVIDKKMMNYLVETVRARRASVRSLAEQCRRPALTALASVTSLGRIDGTVLATLLGTREATSLRPDPTNRIAAIRRVLTFSDLDGKLTANKRRQPQQQLMDNQTIRSATPDHSGHPIRQIDSQSPITVSRINNGLKNSREISGHRESLSNLTGQTCRFINESNNSKSLSSGINRLSSGSESHSNVSTPKGVRVGEGGGGGGGFGVGSGRSGILVRTRIPSAVTGSSLERIQRSAVDLKSEARRGNGRVHVVLKRPETTIATGRVVRPASATAAQQRHASTDSVFED